MEALKETDYAGIDYGFGKTNIDLENHIRYGVIPANEVGQCWFDESEPVYVYMCSECGHDIKEDLLSDECPECKHDFDHDEWNEIEPMGFTLENDEYIMTQSHDDTDIFIIKSKYFTYAQFCSPCAPGAGYLMSPLDFKQDINKTYCLDHSWFENGRAPYKVYDIETSEEIKPEG